MSGAGRDTTPRALLESPPVPVTLDSLLRGVIGPALVASLILLLGWRPWSARRPDGRWSGSLALGLSFFAAHSLLLARPPLPFGGRTLTAQEWLAWIALGGGVLFLFEPRTGRAALALRIALATALLASVLRAKVRNDWDRTEQELWQLGLCLGLILVWSSTELIARRARGASVPCALLLADAFFAVVAGLTGSVFLAQLGGALCAALGAACVLAWWRPDTTLAGPGIAIWAVTHAGLSMCAFFYSYMPGLDALLLGFAPLLAWVGELPVLRRRPPWQIVLGRMLGVALPAGIALVRAALAFESDPYGSY